MHTYSKNKVDISQKKKGFKFLDVGRLDNTEKKLLFI